MDIRLRLDVVPENITKEEWDRVYKETLILIKNYPFMSRVNAEKYGQNYSFYLPAKGGRDKEGNRRWSVCGDLLSRRGGDGFHFPGELKGAKEVGESDNQEDAMQYHTGDIFAMLLEGQEDRIMHLWDGNTHGEPYHLYLLAVGCLVEARLPGAAVVWGDITLGQCKRAVRWANQYLDIPIELSDRAHMDNLYKRVSKLKLQGMGKLEAFLALTLESRDNRMKRFIEAHITSIVEEENSLGIHSEGLDGRRDSTIMHKNFELHEPIEGKQQAFRVKNTRDVTDPSIKYANLQADQNGETLYEIMEREELITFEKGDRIKPELEMEVRQYAAFIRKVGKGDYDRHFQKRDRKSRTRFILANSSQFLMSRDFWKSIFVHIMEDDYMRRFYPLARVKASGPADFEIYYALFSNLELLERYYDG